MYRAKPHDNGGVPKEPEVLNFEKLLRVSPLDLKVKISAKDRLEWIARVGSGPRAFLKLISLLKSYMTENDSLRKEVDSLREELDRKTQ